MKKLYVLFVLIAGLTGVKANAQNDANAKKVLDKVSAKIKTFKGITANFSYITKDKKNIQRGSVQGVINIKGQKYFIKQGTSEIYSDGTKSWNYNGETNEVTEADLDEDSKTLSPQNLMSDFYDKDFTYKLVSSAGQYYEISMEPTDKRKNFKMVTVFVDKAKSIVTKAKVIDKSDNVIEFSLSKINTNADIPDSRFVFDKSKHPGVEVVNQ
ncbi:MAG TPA: outer membrane lipoprotein carrier protein LolA [Chitinophagaceae bacterium]|nr:outer membrane lipoprotein carrier protein LolA [Chitinophagaceae bacterium]